MVKITPQASATLLSELTDFLSPLSFLSVANTESVSPQTPYIPTLLFPQRSALPCSFSYLRPPKPAHCAFSHHRSIPTLLDVLSLNPQSFILIFASAELSPSTSSGVFPSRDFLSEADMLGAHCSPLSLPDITSPPSYVTPGL